MGEGRVMQVFPQKESVSTEVTSRCPIGSRCPMGEEREITGCFLEPVYVLFIFGGSDNGITFSGSGLRQTLAIHNQSSFQRS